MLAAARAARSSATASRRRCTSTEQHAAPTSGRIKPLWRGHGKGYPKGIGPYKIGLLVIERDAAGRLPFGWKRTDRK